jgi:hypothetical protein
LSDDERNPNDIDANRAEGSRPATIRELRDDASRLRIKGYAKLDKHQLAVEIHRIREANEEQKLGEKLGEKNDFSRPDSTSVVAELRDESSAERATATRHNSLPGNTVDADRRRLSPAFRRQVRERGFEPRRVTPLDPKSSASANSATLAKSLNYSNLR